MLGTMSSSKINHSTYDSGPTFHKGKLGHNTKQNLHEFVGMRPVSLAFSVSVTTLYGSREERLLLWPEMLLRAKFMTPLSPYTSPPVSTKKLRPRDQQIIPGTLLMLMEELG